MLKPLTSAAADIILTMTTATEDKIDLITYSGKRCIVQYTPEGSDTLAEVEGMVVKATEERRRGWSCGVGGALVSKYQGEP